MENKQTLEVGTKYLSCKMTTANALKLVLEAVAKGEDSINFAAFKNDQKEKDNPEHANKPNYKSGAVAIWISTKKESTAIQEESI